MLSPLSLFVFLFSFLHYHICTSPIPLARSLSLEVRYEKSLLTRTKTLSTTICFKEPLLFLILFLKRMCFHLLFVAIRT